ncbi:MAG: hypothetical protein FVQ78_09890, partial [Solirubrobacterales bacterium]|nr:hypothetical protein [Solirubrobacterales bacterium]
MRHAKAPSAGSSQGRGSRLGRIFRGALATRGASPGAEGSGAPSHGRTRIALALATALVLALLIAPTARAAPYTSIGEFGASGQADGLFSVSPMRLAADPVTGFLFQADAGNHRVQVFNPKACPECAEFRLSVASHRPLGIAVDPANGDLYTTHPQRNEKQLVTIASATEPPGGPGGTFSLSFEGETTGATGKGDLVELSNEITNVNTETGTFTAGEEISGAGIPAGARIGAVEGTTLKLAEAVVVEAGGGGNEVPLSADLGATASFAAVDRALEALSTIGEGNVKVSLSGANPREYPVTFEAALGGKDVEEMTPSGEGTTLTPGDATIAVTTPVVGLLAGIDKYNPKPTRAAPIEYTADVTFTSPAEGTGEEEVGSFGPPVESTTTSVKPAGIAVDPTNGDIVLGDPGQDEVKRFTSAGAYVPASAFDGLEGSGSAFTDVRDIAVNSEGDVIVADRLSFMGEVRILHFNPSGTAATSLKKEGA